jgi:hypothetical protein
MWKEFTGRYEAVCPGCAARPGRCIAASSSPEESLIWPKGDAPDLQDAETEALLPWDGVDMGLPWTPRHRAPLDAPPVVHGFQLPTPPVYGLQLPIPDIDVNIEVNIGDSIGGTIGDIIPATSASNKMNTAQPLTVSEAIPVIAVSELSESSSISPWLEQWEAPATITKAYPGYDFPPVRHLELSSSSSILPWLAQGEAPATITKAYPGYAGPPVHPQGHQTMVKAPPPPSSPQPPAKLMPDGTPCPPSHPPPPAKDL